MRHALGIKLMPRKKEIATAAAKLGVLVNR